MRRILILLALTVGLLLPTASTASAQVGGVNWGAGSCSWSTAGGAFRWSPAYSVYFSYQGHIRSGSGLNYRLFLIWDPVSGYRYWAVYCG